MKTRQRAARSDTVLIDLEPDRILRRRRRRGGAAPAPRPRRLLRVVRPPSEDSFPVAPLTASAFAPEDFIHSDTPLVCELASMADVEHGEEPFPVFARLLGPPEEDFE